MLQKLRFPSDEEEADEVVDGKLVIELDNDLGIETDA